MGELELGNKIRQELRNGHHQVRVPVKVFANMWFGNNKFSDSELSNKMFDFADKFGVDYTITTGNNPTYNFWRSFAKRRPITMEIRKF